MNEEQSDLAQMVRLALAEQAEDVRLFAARLVRKYRGTAPDLAEQLELFLKSKPARSVSLMRKLSPQPSTTQALPVDDESRLAQAARSAGLDDVARLSSAQRVPHFQQGPADLGSGRPLLRRQVLIA